MDCGRGYREPGEDIGNKMRAALRKMSLGQHWDAEQVRGLEEEPLLAQSAEGREN